jgi:hypothetical protein
MSQNEVDDVHLSPDVSSFAASRHKQSLDPLVSLPSVSVQSAILLHEAAPERPVSHQFAPTQSKPPEPHLQFPSFFATPP